MGYLTDEIQKFHQATANSLYLWRSIDVRVLAVQINGRWHNLMTRCYLDSNPLDEVVRIPHLPVTEHIACEQVVLPLEALTQLLNKATEGELEINDISVCYLINQFQDDKGESPYNSGTYYFSEFSKLKHGSYPDWSTHRLITSGHGIDEILRHVPGGKFGLDNTIRVNSHPFDGVDGLIKFALGNPDPLRSGRTTSFEIIAPLEVRFNANDCRLDNGELHIVVNAGSEAAATNCNLGFFAVGEGSAHTSDSISLPFDKWTQSGSFFTFTGHSHLKGSQVTLFLRMGGYAIHTITLIDYKTAGLNPKVAAYEIFDPDLELLVSWLRPAPNSGGQSFERAVARILTFVGFQADLIAGSRRLGDSVDIIAYGHPLPNVLAIECTTGSIGSGGKLGKLVVRKKRIESALANHIVTGVIVTALKRSEISQEELQAAAEDGLAVLTKEDLDELWNMISSSVASLSNTIDFIQSRIPLKEQYPLH